MIVSLCFGRSSNDSSLVMFWEGKGIGFRSCFYQLLKGREDIAFCLFCYLLILILEGRVGE